MIRSLTRPAAASILVAGLLLLTPAGPVRAQSTTRGSSSVGRQNTWSATSNTGLTLMGTWTGAVDQTTGAVSGSWTLIDARGAITMSGGWSAAKSRAGWSGTWRAVVSGRQGEYSGTWTADVNLPANAPFADLFQKATQAAVSGRWRTGRYFGAWTIRAYK